MPRVIRGARGVRPGDRGIGVCSTALPA